MIKIPEVKKIDLEAIKRRQYDENSQNKNNLSYWFDKIKDCGFRVPETLIIPFTYEQFRWLSSDSYSKESINSFRDYLVAQLVKNNFNTDRILFLKTGTFSDKFSFKNCKLINLDNIGEQFLQIYYTGMIYGAVKTNELVVREFITPKNSRKTIYDGLPLNTEFRAFYDFDKKEVMGVFNYWDKETMIKGLKHNPMEEMENFLDTIPLIEKEVEELKGFLIGEVSEKMKNIELKGQWSIDFMKADTEFYLIDMALAHESYYYGKIKQGE